MEAGLSLEQAARFCSVATDGGFAKMVVHPEVPRNGLWEVSRAIKVRPWASQLAPKAIRIVGEWLGYARRRTCQHSAPLVYMFASTHRIFS